MNVSTLTAYPRRYIRRTLALLIAIGAATGVSSAQPQSDTSGRWSMIDLQQESGFASALEDPTTLFFRTPMIGYYDGRYKTTDGGQTWTQLPSAVPVPHTLIDANFGYSPDGYITNDGGQTWTKIPVKFTDTEPNYQVVEATAYSSRAMAVLYQAHLISGGEAYPVGPKRLAFTLDGGTNWTFADTVDEISQRLLDSTYFGNLPAPAGMTDTFAIGWWKPLGMFDSTTVLMGTVAYGKVAGVTGNYYYLARLNLKERKATFDPLPLNDQVPPQSIIPVDLTFITPDIAYSFQTRNTPSRVYIQWRSVDGGKSWDSIAAPDWLDYSSARFISPTFGVASNGVTEDGGMTWTQWAHPFEDGIFYASDSLHFHLANRFSFYASSNDAGHTWTHNESGAFPRCVAANGPTVLVGRDFRSLLLSKDHGDNWTDVGVGSDMPDDVSAVWQLAFPDSVAEPNRIVGLASFITYSTDMYMGLIESTDGGSTWQEGARIDQLSGSEPTATLDFVTVIDPETSEKYTAGFIASSLGMVASVDGGETWESRNASLSFRDIAMSDSSVGVAATPDGIYSTVDGGKTWTKAQALDASHDRVIGLEAFIHPDFTPPDFRALAPDRQTTYQNWELLTGLSGGTSWQAQNRSGAARPLDATAHWLDADTVIAVGKYATIQLSTDGGGSFALLHDSTAAFENVGGFVVTGRDHEFIYIVGAANVAARWRVGKPVPTAVPSLPSYLAGATLLANPVVGDQGLLRFTLASASTVDLEVYDMLGVRLRSISLGERAAGEYLAPIDVSGMPTGRYVLRVTTDNGGSTLPLVVLR